MHYVIAKDKLLYDFDSVQVSKATYDTQYIWNSIQIMYSISKYTFKLMKPVQIYKVHHNEIVLVDSN